MKIRYSNEDFGIESVQLSGSWDSIKNAAPEVAKDLESVKFFVSYEGYFTLEELIKITNESPGAYLRLESSTWWDFANRKSFINHFATAEWQNSAENTVYPLRVKNEN